MATIIEIRTVVDGSDVVCMFSDNVQRIFHFNPLPENLEEILNQKEIELLAPIILSEARQNTLTKLNLWYDSTIANGVEVNGIILKASTYDQSRLATLATGINTALIVGALSTSDLSPSPIWDKDGVAHNLTVAQFCTLVLLYMTQVGLIESKYSTFYTNIFNESNIDILNSMEFN